MDNGFTPTRPTRAGAASAIRRKKTSLGPMASTVSLLGWPMNYYLVWLSFSIGAQA
jgi:hypothetical protein